MNLQLVTSLVLGSFFSGFFLAWYAVRSAYSHKFSSIKKQEIIQTTTRQRESSMVDLIDSSPEIVMVTNLPEDALDRYIDSISQKQAQLASQRMSRADEPTLKLDKNGKERPIAF